MLLVLHMFVYRNEHAVQGLTMYRGLDVDGVCRVGERIFSGNYLVNKQMPANVADSLPNPTNLPDDQVSGRPCSSVL
jgi:hypothetical protein